MQTPARLLRTVQPLAVVEGEDEWLLLGEHLEARPNRDAQRTRIDGVVRPPIHQQRAFERTSLRSRQCRQQFLDDALQEVGEYDVRQPPLHLCGP